MNDPSSALDRRASLTDIDLYCLSCGYNLRGLSGDPRRCPECGNLNPMGDLELPAGLITAQLRRMETAPAVCVASVAVALLGVYLVVLTFAAYSSATRRIPPEPLGCSFPLTLLSPVVWAIHVHRFKRSCLHKPGWGGALWRYHLYGLSLVGLIVGLLVLGIWLHDQSWSKVPSGSWKGMAFVLQAVGSIAVVLIGGRWAQRKVRDLLDPLQREVAVTLARDRLRKELYSGKRGLHVR